MINKCISKLAVKNLRFCSMQRKQPLNFLVCSWVIPPKSFNQIYQPHTTKQKTLFKNFINYL